MRGALSIAAYRALNRSTARKAFQPSAKRPQGTLVWIHAPEAGSVARFTELALRLQAMDSGLSVLITLPPETLLPPPTPSILFEHVPSDTSGQARAFLDHWHPQICLWAWGGLQPNLILGAAERSVSLFLIDASQDGFDNQRERWLPEVARHSLKAFELFSARSKAAQAQLVKLGCDPDRIELNAALRPGPPVLPAAQSKIDTLTAALAARPVWFAEGIVAEEVPHLMTAQRTAQRLSHRLLLIAAPADDEADALIETLCRSDRTRFQRWSEGLAPDETTSVLIADIAGESGLWLRLAPLAFMGGSLGPGAKGRDPMHAAALGAAVLYGPGVGDHLEAYRRLAEVGAARIVGDGPSLAAAVSQLIAPDQAARMAVAGWGVVTEGAATTDRILDLTLSAVEAQAQGAI